MENPNLLDSFVYPSLVVGVFVVCCTLLFSYICNLFKIEHDAEEKNQSEQVSSTSERKKESSSGKPKKKQTWTRNTDRKKFTSPWLLKTLKNHTGQVLNIDYSSSGKYLASCGEEDPDPDPDMSSSSGSESNKENNRPPSVSPSTKGLSRRQRKNRKREDSPPEKKKGMTVESPQTSPNMLTEYQKLNVDERQLSEMLHDYLLTDEQRFSGGYPMITNDFNSTVMYFNQDSFGNKMPGFDVNAREFVPANQRRPGSVPSSESSEVDSESGSEPDLSMYGEHPANHRSCARCGHGFFVTETDYLTHERCVHHWGKLLRVPGIFYCRMYTCCQGGSNSPGCTVSNLHVWSGSVAGMNGPFEGYVKTRRRGWSNVGVYALDCEMCFTIAGLEVTKVTVVGIDGRLVYDSFVRPDNPIIDYNTRFSGITARDLVPGKAKSLREVQNDLKSFITAETILIGHGLENDLRALKMVHDKIVDTAWCFPHYQGLPYKRSLKSLVSSVLRREVQCGSQGHDSYEDACSAMELMLYKVRREFGSVLRA